MIAESGARASFRLVSWNLNGRRNHVTAQVTALAERVPNVIALQEVTRGMVDPLRSRLLEAGFPHAVASFELAPPSFVPAGPRRYGLLVASRYPLASLAPEGFPVPWPERVLSVTANVDGEALEFHVTHVPPGSSNGWIKVEHLQGLYAGLARHSSVPRILCGDFNTPQAELPSGDTVTWAQRRRSSGAWATARAVRGGPGESWDAAERRVLRGLADWDLPDVFRQLHGYDRSEASWILRRHGSAVARRFDHIFASTALRPTRCEYLHAWREGGLSDHSAIEADFSWPDTGSARDVGSRPDGVQD